MITSLHRGLRPSVPLTSAIKKLTARIRQTACVNMSMKAIVFHENGDSSKLSFEDVPVPEAEEGEVLVKNHYAGLNFIDVAVRKGFRALVNPPGILGFEASGTVEELGPGVEGVSVGDKVAYAVVGAGTYAEYSKVPIVRAVSVPDKVTMEQAASALWQGFTAHVLAHSAYLIKPEDKVLIHAAAGGVGTLLVQMAKNAGAFVIGTMSTEAKAAKAKAAGADEVVLYSEKDFVEEVNRITQGQGVNVIYDSVGKTTFHRDFDCLAKRGTVVAFGTASGAPEPLQVASLARGSFHVTYPANYHYIEDPKEYMKRANDIFQWLGEGKLNFAGGITVLPLSEAKKAHDMLEGRATTGKVLLKP